MKFQMSILRDLAYGAAAQGVNFNDLCRKSGVDPRDFNDAQRMIDWEFAPQIWDNIVALSGDQFAGLHMGQQVRPSVFGMMGHLLQTCKDLHEVLDSIVRFGDTWSSIFKFSLKKNEATTEFHFAPVILYQEKYPVSARQATEMAISGTLSLLQVLSGTTIVPDKLYIPFDKKDVQAYRSVCNCEISLHATQTYFIFAKHKLDASVLSHDRSLFFMFQSLLEDVQKKLGEGTTFSQKIFHSLVADFKGQVPPIEVIASKFYLNTRTFQRKLAAERTTYRQLCQRLQKELSSIILKKSDRSYQEVAELLGFADHTTLRRAMKRN